MNNFDRKFDQITKMSILTLFFLMIVSWSAHAQKNNKQMNLFDFKTTDIDGNAFDMSSLKGKKVMIVNVASKCGFTPQYEQLQQLYETYGDEKFVIVGFPSNDFKQQEPGTDAEIKEFCTLNYGVTFPMMSKITVVGDDKAPLYQWLTEKEYNGVIDQEVTWNFQKYLINEHGELYAVLMPKEEPFNEKIIQWLEGD